jgi:hypothetical protein
MRVESKVNDQSLTVLPCPVSTPDSLENTMTQANGHANRHQLNLLQGLREAWCQSLPTRGVQVFTISWLLPVCGLLAIGTFLRRPIFPYRLWSSVVLCGTAASFFLGILAILIASSMSRRSEKRWVDDPWLFALVLFWAIFPPLWFMAEGACYDGGVICSVTYRVAEGDKEKEYDIAHCPLNVKREFLRSLRESQESAAKGWAAAGLLLGLILSQIKGKA